MRVFLFLFQVFTDGHARPLIPTACTDTPFVGVEDKLFLAVVDLTGDDFELDTARATALERALGLYFPHNSAVVRL